MLTEQQQTEAIALLNDSITPRKGIISRKYKQVLPYSPDGIHTVFLDVYSGNDEGYTKRVVVAEGEKMCMYSESVGNESGRPLGWVEYDPDKPDTENV